MGELTDPPQPPSADGFGSTAWSLVLAAQNQSNEPALDRLCQKYWKPIYAFARRSGLAPADAEDAVQDFFAYLLQRSWIQQADPERGSFRAFLLTLFRNFIANHRRRERALKRGGAERALSFDTAEGEAELAACVSALPDPAATYDRIWAQCVLHTALTRLGEEQSGPEKKRAFELLRPFVAQRPEAGDYERLARELGQPRNRIAVLIHRLSRRYAELIRIEVADTLADRKQVESELRGLLQALSS